jgi:hypothetical protein
MTRFFLVLAGACALLAAQDAGGLKPRPGLTDYAVHEAGPMLTLAAEALSPRQVSDTFATDLNRGWIVVEVAIYPADSLEVKTSDFVLRVTQNGSGALVRPANPRSIAGILQRKDAPGRTSGSDITIHPAVGIGYETGSRYDPRYGGRRAGGWTTAVGVGVGVGETPGAPPPPASSPADRQTMEQELGDQALPEGATAKPAAGYLYFPRPANFRNPSLQLHYEGPDGPIRLDLPQPKQGRR